MAEARERVTLRVWSDYLCPWCHQGNHRLSALRDASDGRIELDFRAFLLRPHPTDSRNHEKFVRYTESWQRPAAEPDAAPFSPWSSEEGPPSHSVPAHLVAKAARRVSEEGFRTLHELLLRAYFVESRDISRRENLVLLWERAGLPPADFALSELPELLEQVVDEHNQGIELGVTGVPAVGVDGLDAAIVGAHPRALYERLAERALAGLI